MNHTLTGLLTLLTLAPVVGALTSEMAEPPVPEMRLMPAPDSLIVSDSKAAMTHAGMAGMSGMQHAGMNGMTQTAMTSADEPQGCNAVVTLAMNDALNPGMQHGSSAHEMPADLPVPQLALTLTADSMSGINLHMTLRDFALQPPGTEPVQGVLSGHAHLYVNGKKIQRLYGPDVHIPAETLNPGVNLVLVSLNDDMHATYTHEGRELMSSVFIRPQAQQLTVVHTYNSSPLGDTAVD
ncbi:hypothetical protein ACQUQU_01550 [Thalassolituus sp. LLYu03]|uniref:hypothetical protein n=1 Tax=Thalassolituus sp. LLYu03 TaxID=3421656 RepID=UPI003D27B064